MTSVSPGQQVPLEAQWLIDGVAQSGAATVTLRNFIGGVERYWTGSAWTTTPTSLASTPVAGFYRYLLTIPSAWLDLIVEVTHSLPGNVDQTAELAVVSSVTALGSPAQATDVATLLARLTSARAAALDLLDVAVSTRASAASYTAARAALLDRLDVLLSSRAAVTDIASALNATLAAVASRAAQTSVDALGHPLQDNDPRADRLDVAISTRATAAALTSGLAALAAQITALDVTVELPPVVEVGP